MTKAVLFDLFETLVTEQGTTQTRAGTLGHVFGVDSIAFRKAWKPYRPRVIRGELSFGAALAAVGAELDARFTPSAIQHACELRAREKAAVFDRIAPALVETVRSLHRQGIRLAVVSNCFEEDVQAWPRCALQPYFSAAVFSFAHGSAKPEPAIYLEGLRQLGVAPEETLFIGDGGDGELDGAARAGLRVAQATWYVDRGRLSESLASWTLESVIGKR